LSISIHAPAWGATAILEIIYKKVVKIEN